jgi:hypothetical protein
VTLSGGSASVAVKSLKGHSLDRKILLDLWEVVRIANGVVQAVKLRGNRFDMIPLRDT